jgi:hypothetical protein
MTEEEIYLIINDQARATLEDRHIVEEDIKKVIALAESVGNKLRQPDDSRFLAKRRLENYTLYVEYARDGDRFVLLTAYSHRGIMKLL